MADAGDVREALAEAADSADAVFLQRFFKTGPGEYGEGDPQEVFDRYLAAVRRGRINNWDLVDASAEHIVGEHLRARDRSLLDGLAASGSLWERRVAVLATFQFIKSGQLRSRSSPGTRAAVP